ncbi:hypothetical protein LY78DRAFT_26867 [Colletotrichum sublineola]|nr:hypothetical protein LY78DRAFT_26867 [Colletotrichum sublineola]
MPKSNFARPRHPHCEARSHTPMTRSGWCPPGASKQRPQSRHVRRSVGRNAPPGFFFFFFLLPFTPRQQPLRYDFLQTVHPCAAPGTFIVSQKNLGRSPCLTPGCE